MVVFSPLGPGAVARRHAEPGQHVVKNLDLLGAMNWSEPCGLLARRKSYVRAAICGWMLGKSEAFTQNLAGISKARDQPGKLLHPLLIHPELQMAQERRSPQPALVGALL